MNYDDFTFIESGDNSEASFDLNTKPPPLITKPQTPGIGLKAPIVTMNSICNYSESTLYSPSQASTQIIVSHDEQSIKEESIIAERPKTMSTVHIDTTDRKSSLTNEGNDKSEFIEAKADTTRQATFFDVAVMRCLLSSKWHSEG